MSIFSPGQIFSIKYLQFSLSQNIGHHALHCLHSKYRIYNLSQNFDLDQIERIGRRQNKSDTKTEICLGKGRKYCWKRRKCWLPAFPSLPTMFSKGFF